MDVDRNIQRRNLSFKLFVENSYCCSVTKLCLTLQFHGLQHTRIFSPPLSPGVCSDSCSLSRWCCLTISSSAVSFFFCLQSFPASGFPFQWVDSLHQVAKVLEFQLQHKSFQWIFRDDFLQYRLVWSPYNPRNSQDSSPISWFKSICSLVLSLLYGPTLTSIHGYCKNHNFD